MVRHAKIRPSRDDQSAQCLITDQMQKRRIVDGADNLVLVLAALSVVAMTAGAGAGEHLAAFRLASGQRAVGLAFAKIARRLLFGPLAPLPLGLQTLGQDLHLG